MRISDWSSDVCSSDLSAQPGGDRRLSLYDRDRGQRCHVGYREARLDAMECWSPSTLWEKRKKSRRRTSTPQAAQFSNGRRDGPARPVPPRSGDAVPSTDAPSVGCEAGNSEPVWRDERPPGVL